MALEQHVKQYDVDLMNWAEGEEARAGPLIEIELENGATSGARRGDPSTGALARDECAGREGNTKAKGVCFAPTATVRSSRGKRVAVIGGGNSGVEAAIDLAGIVSHVTLFEFADTRADAVLQTKLYSLPNVTVIKSAQTTEVDRRRSAERPASDQRPGRVEHLVGFPKASSCRSASRPTPTGWKGGRFRRTARSSSVRHLPGVRGGRLHHRALQADHHRHGRARGVAGCTTDHPIRFPCRLDDEGLE